MRGAGRISSSAQSPSWVTRPLTLTWATMPQVLTPWFGLRHHVPAGITATPVETAGGPNRADDDCGAGGDGDDVQPAATATSAAQLTSTILRTTVRRPTR